MPLIKTIKNKTEYAGLLFLTGLVKVLPLDYAANLSAKAWCFFAPKNRRHKRALANLKIGFPEKTDEEREAIAMGMWDNLGRVMVETMVLDKIIEQPDRITVLNKEITDRYSGKLGPGVCLSLHTGNWELSSWPMLLMKAEPAAVYKKVSNPYVDTMIQRKRMPFYPGGMFAKSAKDGGEMKIAREINQFVRDGGRIGMLADLHFLNGVNVPFFGKPAPTNPFPAMLTRRYGCRLWLGRTIRKGKKSHFEVEIKELQVPFTKDMHADMEAINLAIHSQFEEWVREYPEQWMWSNRRWS